MYKIEYEELNGRKPRVKSVMSQERIETLTIWAVDFILFASLIVARLIRG